MGEDKKVVVKDWSDRPARIKVSFAGRREGNWCWECGTALKESSEKNPRRYCDGCQR